MSNINNMAKTKYIVFTANVQPITSANFASGKERIGSKNASFMFHGVSMNLEKSSLAESQLKELYNSLKKLKEDIAKGVSAYADIELSKIQELMIEGGVKIGR